VRTVSGTDEPGPGPSGNRGNPGVTPAGGGVQSVDRAGQILSFLADQGERGVTEIAAQLGVHKSTAFRILQTLEGWHLVEQDGTRGGYRLGVGLVRLGSIAARDLDVTQVSRAECERLARELGESVNVAVRDGASEVNVLQVTGPATVGTRNWVGQRTPLYATSTGKILLGELTVREMRDLLGTVLAPLTSHTVRTIAELAEHVEQGKVRGYATGIAELELGLNAVAVPIRDASGAIVAALSVSGPAYRLSEDDVERIAAALRSAASSVSASLGYRSA
jgi:DNA-binding IclR family transcriptional regulator